MQLPITPDQFFDVFRRYNEAVWPAQILLLAIGAFTAFAAWRANAKAATLWARTALGMLSVLWLWSGIAYDKVFFATVTPAADIFGSLFVAEAALLLICLWLDSWNAVPVSNVSRFIGASLIAYALVLYPIVGLLLGHRYPAVPSFGTPCPVTIFTFGVFCLLPAHIGRFAVAIPLLWALIGSYGGVAMGVPEDAGLIVGAAAAVVVLHHEWHRPGFRRVAV